MGYEKLKRPLSALSFVPNPTGIALADLAQGTDGQVPVAATGGPTAYQSLSGDVTMNNAGVTAVGAKKITIAKSAAFFSAQLTGTGSSQNIAHGLGVVPSAVLIVPTDGGTVVPGSHSTTNVVATVTTGKKFDVLAWA